MKMKGVLVFHAETQGGEFMIRRFMLLFILMLVTVSTVFSQERRREFRPGMMGGTIKGHVIDEALQVPIEYANVLIYNQRDSSQVTGTITDSEGNFLLTRVRPGNFYMEVSFMGYHTHTVDKIEISPDKKEINLGTISLKQVVIQLEGIESVTEKPALEYKIDKKVVNVEKHYTATSGTAVDVLENVPSVTVDIEGNVQLRGSSNFTVLIDGRPTILEPNDALQQIPASTIENIEIITNPSAKYDPDGTTGIINIVMKKNNELRGTSGIVNLNVGDDDKYGGDFLFNYKRKKYSLLFGANYNKRSHTGESEVENRTFTQDTTSYIQSSGDRDRGREFFGVRGGIELYLSSHDDLIFGFRYGEHSMEGSSRQDYDEWTEPGDQHNPYISQEKSERSGEYYSLNLDYRHRFAKEGHEISGEAVYSGRDGDDDTVNELRDANNAITSGQHSTEAGPSHRLRLKINYVLPIREKDRFEAGYQSRLRDSEEINELYDYNPESDTYEFQPEFSYTTEYERNIHSLYTMYAGECESFGYQAGLRGEYTDRYIQLVDEDESFTIDRWDYFPTAHVSYKLPAGQQLMASYTRRIHRPRSWYLEPFETWMDAYNVRVGNPALKPEYIDSYELGYQIFFGKNLLSAETYYRKTNNRVERIRSVYEDNITLHSIENVGTDYALGTEFMFNVNLFQLWNMNLMSNIYDYEIKGTLYDEPFSRDSFNWDARMNHTFMLRKSTRLQINGMYHSKSVSAQGERKGFFMTNLAIKQDLMGKNLSATLQIRDLLGTGKHESFSKGKDFYKYSHFTREAPIFMLNISYNINNYRPEREREQEREEFEGDEEF